MEKRFSLIYRNDNYWDDLFDEETQQVMNIYGIVDLLNKQDEKIKELKSELHFKNNIIWDENDKTILCGDCYCLNNDVRKLVEENQQLKQSSNCKAIEVLEKVKEYCENWKLYADYYNYVLVEETAGVRTIQTLYEFINNQITELRGKKND